MLHNHRSPLSTFSSILFASAALILGSSPVASGEPIVVTCVPFSPCIDFAHDGFNIGGTVTYAGGSAPLVGSDIPVNRVFGFFTPEHPDPAENLFVENGFLNFETGAFDSFDPILGYHFSAGGSFTIEGSIPALGLVDAVLAQGSFFQAYFGGGTFVYPNVFDTKHEDIVEYFGMPGGTYFLGGYLTTEFTSATGEAFTARVTSLDLPNTPTETPTAIPEPTSLLLLGSGALGWLAKAGRRRKTAPRR
jgi:hypothetical protein